MSVVDSPELDTSMALMEMGPMASVMPQLLSELVGAGLLGGKAIDCVFGSLWILPPLAIK